MSSDGRAKILLILIIHILILNGLQERDRNFWIEEDGDINETDVSIPQNAKGVTWETWKEEEKGIQWYRNIFKIAPCLSQSVDDQRIQFELRKVEVLNPNGELKIADHAIVHLQFQHNLRIIDVALESFSGLISGHQFYSEDQEERHYEKYIQTGRHSPYVSTRSLSNFANLTSYSLAFEKINKLHSELAYTPDWSCHVYARRVYHLFC